MKDITVRLSLDDKDFKVKIEGSAEALKTFQSTVERLNPSLRKGESSFSTWGKRLRDTVIVLGLARHAVMNLDAALLSLPRSIIQTNAEFEKMTALMRGLSSETSSYAGILEQAEKDKSFVIEMGLNSPFNISSLQDSFAKFRSAGIDPTNNSLQSLIDSVAKFGGSSNELKRATIAIQQMAGKGTISLEELRQQLGEVIPDAIQIMARGVGTSVGELTAEISKGTVAATGGLQALFRQMAIENNNAALEMSQTWDGTFARMQTRWALFEKEIGDAGFFDEVKNQLTILTDEILASPEALQFARDLGEAGAALVGAFTGAASLISEFSEEIKLLAGVFAVYLIKQKALILGSKLFAAETGVVTKQVNAVRTSFNGYMATTAKLAVQQKAIEVAAGRTAISFHAQSLAMIRAQAAANALKTSMTGLAATAYSAAGGWVGILTTAVIGLTTYMTLFRENYAKVVADIDANRPELITDDQREALDLTIKKYRELRTEWLTEADPKFALAAKKAMDDFLASTGKTVEEMQRLVEISELNKLERQLDSINRQLKLEAGRELRANVNQYKKQLDDIISNEKLSKEKREELIKEENSKLSKIIDNYYAEEIAKAKAEADRLYSIAKDKGEKQVTEAIRTVEELRKLRVEAQKPFLMEEGGLDQNEKDAEKKKTAFNNYLESQRENLAKYNARLQESNDIMAVFRERLSAGDFGDITEKQRRDIEGIIKSLKAAKDKWKLMNDEAKEFEKLAGKVNQISNSIAQSFARRENKNPFLKDIIAADGYRAKLEAVRDDLSKLTTKSAETAREIEKIDLELSKLDNKATASIVADLEEQTRKINNGLLPSVERINKEYEDTTRHLREMIELNRENFSASQLAAIERYMNALDAQRIEDLKTPFDDLLDSWADTTTMMGNLWSSMATQLTSELADAVVEGKLQFDDLTKSFIKMIVEMQLRMLAANLFGVFSGGFTGAGTAANPADPSVLGAKPGTTGQPLLFANGGIMTEFGKAELRKYAKGGVAHSPQVAIYGEGSQPEAYVPLPDGRTIPVTIAGTQQSSGSGDMPDISFNLINQTGQPVSAEQTGARFDGRQMILDVVMTEVSRPGQFRDGMKGALR